jgi:E2/UBC family protein E
MIVGEDHLSADDAEFLKRKGWECEVTAVKIDGGKTEIHIVVRAFPFPDKFQPRSADILVRQLPGYPETGMDMFWTRPDVVLAATGHKPDRADAIETYGGIPWQRWSRHLNGWRREIDNLETFFASIVRELAK